MLTPEQITTLMSGATAGICVDVAVYPLDTIKTRLQALSKSIKPKSQLHLFAGLPAVLFGSAPGAALFFCAYETSKRNAANLGAPSWASSMLAASIGEIVACIVRVPCETIKQRAQHRPHVGVGRILSETIRSEGSRGIYRGYLSTIFRELPFSLIQYPIWEALKTFMEARNRRETYYQNLPIDQCTLSNAQFALCGGFAGAFAGACTTPLDVVKTRIMLAEKGSVFSTSNAFTVLRLVYYEFGIRSLFAGLIPRVSLLAIGGSIFLGLYDITKNFWENKFHLHS